MVSKALVVGAYHSKLAELAALPELDLVAIVPPGWRDERGWLPLERVPTRGYQLVTTPLRFNGSFHLHYYPQLPWLLKQLRPDLVHIDEEPYNLATWLGLRTARSIRARSLFFSWQNLNRRYPLPFNLIERDVLSHADAAIAGNRAAVQVWRDKGYRGPIKVIPQFGVDPVVYAPRPRERSTGQLVIGYAGRFVEEKGVDILLEAAAGLEGDWRVDLIGSGPAQTRLIDLARSLGIADRVRFLPWVSSAHIADVYRSFDVLVLPSRSKPNWIEQFGRVLVEAMACGVPVVGSTCGEIPEVIGNAGLIFPEGDVTALREDLQCLYDQPALRAELAQRGRQRVLDHFTQAQIARQTYEMYQQIMRPE